MEESRWSRVGKQRGHPQGAPASSQAHLPAVPTPSAQDVLIGCQRSESSHFTSGRPCVNGSPWGPWPIQTMTLAAQEAPGAKPSG